MNKIRKYFQMTKSEWNYFLIGVQFGILIMMVIFILVIKLV